MFAALVPFAILLSRRGESSGGGCAPVGCFLVLIGLGVVLYLVFRGRSNRQRIDGASARPMGTAPIQPHTFACPFPKCPNCGATADKQKQQWDGLRSVTWSCGYCGHTQVQALKDEELPPSARQRLGLDGGQGYGPRRDFDGDGFGGGGMGSGLGGVMTGMMLGSMLGGSHHHGGSQDGWGGGSDSGGGSGDNWDSGGDSGGGWDGGGDSGGGDWGGGDSGGDW